MRTLPKPTDSNPKAFTQIELRINFAAEGLRPPRKKNPSMMQMEWREMAVPQAAAHIFCRQHPIPNPQGGVPCRGSGGSWGRNQRHGESKNRFRSQQITPARAAVLILRAGVWGRPAHMSAISLPETKPANKPLSRS